MKFQIPTLNSTKGLYEDGAGASRYISSADVVSFQFDDEFYARDFSVDVLRILNSGYVSLHEHWLTEGQPAGVPGRFKLLASKTFGQYSSFLDREGSKAEKLYILISASDAGDNLTECLKSLAMQSFGAFIADVAMPSEAACAGITALARDLGLAEKVKVVVQRDREQLSDILGASSGCSYILFLDECVSFSFDAILDFSVHMAASADTALIYADEGIVKADGTLLSLRKPSWAPETFLSSAYSCGCTIFSRDFIGEALKNHPGRLLQPSLWEFDLTLLAWEQSERIHHLPKVMTWIAARDKDDENKEYAEALRERVRDWFGRQGLNGGAAERPQTMFPSPVAHADDCVSIVIPTADRSAIYQGEKINLLDKCIERLHRYDAAITKQIIAVHNDDMSLARRNELRARNVTLVEFMDPKFNFSKKINIGVQKAEFSSLLLLNDDVFALRDGWLQDMMSLLKMPSIGAVGPKLLFPDGLIQHIGCGFIRGTPYHPYYGADTTVVDTYAGLADGVRNSASVTAACMLTRREAFDAVGGFDEQLHDLYNDSAFCLKLRKLDWRVLYTGECELMHLESVSLDPDRKYGNQREIFERWWGAGVELDPYYNPGISMWEPFRWKHPPDIGKRWTERGRVLAEDNGAKMETASPGIQGSLR